MTPEEVIKHLRAVLGPEQVAARSSDATAHAQVDAWLPPASRALAIVYPRSAEDVQSLVREASKLDIAINSVPNAAGNGAVVSAHATPTVLLDLRRMNRILELDPDSACALVEPGVSFDDLHTHLEQRDIPLWIDADANGANSISGSICERAFGYSPYGDHLLMQCGMEVVLANGELVRTGMGALPGNDTWQLFKYNFGPYVDGLFSRSDLAVVTKMGLWLMPQPPAWQPFMLSLDNDAALGDAMEVLRPLKIGMVIPNTVIAAQAHADNALARRAGVSPRSGDPFAWRLYGALYGIAGNVTVTWSGVHAAFENIPGARVVFGDEGADDAVWQLRKRMMQGRPAFTAPAASAPRCLSFTVGAPIERESITEMEALLAPERERPWRREYAVTWRTLQQRFELPYDSASLEAATARALSLIDALGDAGFAVTHDSSELRAEVARRQTGAGLSVLYDKLDQALDPRAVLRRAKGG